MEVPTFQADHMMWMNKFDGMIAIAAVRGGGDKGEEWHKAGMLD